VPEASDVNFIVAFAFGAISFVSPCVLPLLPGYLSLMSGYSVQELSEGKANVRKVAFATLLFIAGFSLVFVGLGAIATGVGSFLRTNLVTLSRVAGLVIIIMGVFIAVTALWNPQWLMPFMRERRVDVKPSRLGNFAPPVMGAAFAFGWTPCIGPVLGSIFALAAVEETVGRGMMLLFFYVFGGAISAGTGVDYAQFLVLGAIVSAVLIGASVTREGLASDLAEGVTERFRSVPMVQVAVLAGRTIADGLRNVLTAIVVAAAGHLLGFRFDDPLNATLALLLAIGAGYAISWANALVAVLVQDPQLVPLVRVFWLFPLLFAGTVFTPVDHMPGWLRGFAENQPVSVVADAMRALSEGLPAADLVWRSVLWIVTLTALFAFLAAAAYRRNRR